MKFALLSALIALSAAQSYLPQTPVRTVVYKPGMEYIYHYKGQILSGIPKASNQFSGLLIDTLVVLQFQQDYRVVMKLEKIKFFKINDKITTEPKEPIREEELTQLTGDQAMMLGENLVKPVKFRYVEGAIQQLEKEIQDPFWSTNIKKGILSLLQVTLKEKTSSSPSFLYDPDMNYYPTSRKSSSIPFWKNGYKHNSVYKVVESDVTGVCDTKYSIISDKSITSGPSKMHVTAIRDFDNCDHEPFYIRGIFQGVYNYEEEENILHPTVHTDYVITGDRTHFLINEATLRGKYSFMVHGLDGGSMNTFIYQKLTLKSDTPMRSPIRLVSPKPCTLGLMMTIPELSTNTKTFQEMKTSRGTYWTKTDDSSSYETEETIGETGDIVPVVEKKLDDLISCLYPTKEIRCSEILNELERIISRLPREPLKTVIFRHLSDRHTEIGHRKSEVLLDLLPTLTTPASAKIILDLIKEKYISEIRGSVMIKGMSLIVKPTPEIIRLTMDLFKELPKEPHSKLNGKTLLRQSVLLSVGTMTHRLINKMRMHGKPQSDTLNFLEYISGDLKRMLEETTSESDKILILKSMGNMGASQTIPILKSLVENPSVPLKLRIQSVFALRRLIKQFSKQVTPVLLGIYMDTKEETELRQAAFIVVIHSNPGFPTLQMIAHGLRHEPSHRIRTLVYSSLVNLAVNTEHEPEHKELIKDARLIIKNIPPVLIGPYDTVSVQISKFLEEYDMGGSINLLKTKSKTSGLPDALIANIQGTLLGKHRHLLEVGVEGKSLEILIRKVFGPHGLLKEMLKGKITISDLLKPLMRQNMGRTESMMREILSKMMIELTSDEKPFGTWYLHVLSNELQYVLLNTENVEELINKVSTVLPEILMKLSRGLNVDVLKAFSTRSSLTVSSPLGIPLNVNSTVSAVLKVHGHVKVNNLPTWSDVMSRSFLSNKLGLEVDLKPHFDALHYLTVGADLRWLKSGVCIEKVIRSTVPVKLTTSVNLPEHTMSVKYFIPKETLTTFHFKIRPVTFIKYVPLRVHKLPYTIEFKEITSEKIVKTTPFRLVHPSGILGLDIETSGLYSVCGPLWCPDMPLFGRQELTVIVKPRSSVDYLHLKIKSLKRNIDWEGVPLQIPTEELYGDDDDDEEYMSERSRISTRKMVTPGEFDNIKIDPMFTDPIKRQIIVTLGPNTQVTPKVKGLFTWLMGRQYWKHQFNAQVVRMSSGETPAWKIHWNGAVNPTVVMTEPTFETYRDEPIAKSHLSWSIYGHEQEIKIRLLPGSEFDFSHELKEHKILTAFSLPIAKVQKLKFTLEAEFSHMGKKTLKAITVGHDTLKYFLWQYLTTSIPTSPQHKKVTVAVELLPWWEQMNIIVKTPMVNSYIANVPFYLNPLFPTDEKIKMHDVPSWVFFNHTEDYETSDYRRLFTPDYSNIETVPYTRAPFVGGECLISGRDFTTTSFDGVNRYWGSFLKYGSRGCSTLITQDCSNTGLLSVIGSGTPDEWKLKIVIPDYEITTTTGSSRIHVIVNGEEKPISTDRPLIITEEGMSEYSSSSSQKIVKIEKFSSKVVEVKLYELGATILIDSENLFGKIKLAPWSTLQGQLCGLCGNYNYDQSDDFLIPDNVKVPTSRSFFESNVLPSETCDITSVSQTDDEFSMTEKHVTVRRYDNDVPMICRSEQKVRQCAHGYRPESMKSVKTCFTCTPENSSVAPRTYYPVPSWDEDRSVDCTDFYQRVEIPTRCVPKY